MNATGNVTGARHCHPGTRPTVADLRPYTACRGLWPQPNLKMRLAAPVSDQLSAKTSPKRRGGLPEMRVKSIRRLLLLPFALQTFFEVFPSTNFLPSYTSRISGVPLKLLHRLSAMVSSFKPDCIK